MHWTYDTWMLAQFHRRRAWCKDGGDSWFFVTADYAFGHSMEAEAAQFVGAAGGRVLGAARFPFPGTTDFSAFLLRAQASRAKVIGLASRRHGHGERGEAGGGIRPQKRGQQLAALILFITESTLGPRRGAGAGLPESFYWDLNDRTRAF